MPRARSRKDTPFQNTVTRNVFLYGNPNKENFPAALICHLRAQPKRKAAQVSEPHNIRKE